MRLTSAGLGELSLDSLVVIGERALQKGEDERQLRRRLQRRRHRREREADAMPGAPSLVARLGLAWLGLGLRLGSGLRLRLGLGYGLG